ncbi:lymphocyte-specific protein 1 isoform X2 [Nothobranchius furzeri]|uniref:Transcript variant X2 n=1 Tax=Nothobranchius furzeri TaxID=105023 RepID=A0A9D2Y986_NOTFU|nr:trichohyalin isoform X2 [Nothobranchius furzeri]KAF7215104.1 transcript variant X2 [Nothobranchius furzeri]
MSKALVRRNSSKQGLQNLMRLTSQRSIEDAEEVERERRQRARRSLRQRNNGLTPDDFTPDTEMPAKENMWQSDMKSDSSPSIEVDEGFSDWTQRREKQRRQQELSQDGSEEENLEEDLENKVVTKKFPQAFRMSSSRFQMPEQKENVTTSEKERRNEGEDEEWRKKERDMLISNRKEEIQILQNKEIIVCSRDGAILGAEQQLQNFHMDLQEENQELERHRHRRVQAKWNQQELRRCGEDRREFQEEDEQQRKGQKQQQLPKDEDRKGVNVGVANRITQWVKSPSDSSNRPPTFRPIIVKPGDVMHKKNMWEVIGDSSGSLEQRTKPAAAGKKYKFVITGHGKYEKIPVDNTNDGELN